MPADPLIGQTLPSEVVAGVGYYLDRLLAEGGTARAYFAIRMSREGRSPVVVKVILPHLVSDGTETASLVIRKEAVALGRINERMPPCPYVVRFVDTGTVRPLGARTPEVPWLATEYVHGGVEGTALDERVEGSIRVTGFGFDPPRAARAVEALSRGLEEIHGAGVIHRDLKPGNVLCCGSGETEMFKISDFGVARSVGLSATFGDMTVGTPGYLAPEQVLSREIGPQTDIFTFSCVVYFVLTGEHYFFAENSFQAYQEVQESRRRSLMDAPGLCPELREHHAAVSAIDAALARATSPNPEARPSSALEFAEGLMPWLTDQPGSMRLSPRYLGSMSEIRCKAELGEPTCSVRHPPVPERLILSAMFNAAGHCLAATLGGLEAFDGTRWAPFPPSSQYLTGQRLCCVRRYRPVSWVVGTSGAQLCEVAREGNRLLVCGPDPSWDFVDVSGDLEDLAVVVATRPGEAPSLLTRVGRRWLRAMQVPGCAALSGICQLGEEQWLVVGRSLDGKALALRYAPLALDLEPLPAPDARALLASASRRGRGVALAVGADGAALVVDGTRVESFSLPGRPHLSALAMDGAGNAWFASAGRIWTRSREGTVACVWEDESWRSPFVTLHAETGHALALTVDGGVLEISLGEAGPASTVDPRARRG